MTPAGADGAAPDGGPAWTRNASPAAAFLRGVRETPLVPGLMLLSAVMGFGVLARDHGFTLGQAMFVTASVFALPGQVALIDQLDRGAAPLAAMAAVAFTAVRLLPMTVVIAPYLKGSRLARPWQFVASHFVAVTLWVEGLRRLPALPAHVRLPYFLGYGLTLGTLSVAATAIGFLLMGVMPPLLGAALVFMTPIYFTLSLLSSARGSLADHLAIGLGLLLGPPLFLLVPGYELVLTGLLAGSLAYGAGRARGE